MRKTVSGITHTVGIDLEAFGQKAHHLRPENLRLLARIVAFFESLILCPMDLCYVIKQALWLWLVGLY